MTPGVPWEGAASILHSTYQDIIGEDGLEAMSSEFADFNDSILVFLPSTAITLQTRTIGSWRMPFVHA